MMKKLILIITLIFSSVGITGEITFEGTGKQTSMDILLMMIAHTNFIGLMAIGKVLLETLDYIHAWVLLLLIKTEKMGLMFTAKIYLKKMTIL